MIRPSDRSFLAALSDPRVRALWDVSPAGLRLAFRDFLCNRYDGSPEMRETFARYARAMMTYAPHASGDDFALPSIRNAKESLEATNTYLERLDGDVDKAVKAKKISASTKDSLGYRYKRFYGDWLAYYKGIQENGIDSASAGNVKANADNYRSMGDAYAKELKDAGVATTQGPPAPADPPPILPPFSGVAVGGILGVALAFGGFALLLKATK